jgi:hypothetical protein
MVWEAQSIEIRRVILHKGTGMFFAGVGRWVNVLDNAELFDSIKAASETMARDGLSETCEIVVRFDDEPDHDLRVSYELGASG